MRKKFVNLGTNKNANSVLFRNAHTFFNMVQFVYIYICGVAYQYSSYAHQHTNTRENVLRNAYFILYEKMPAACVRYLSRAIAIAIALIAHHKKK